MNKLNKIITTGLLSIVSFSVMAQEGDYKAANKELKATIKHMEEVTKTNKDKLIAMSQFSLNTPTVLIIGNQERTVEGSAVNNMVAMYHLSGLDRYINKDMKIVTKMTGDLIMQYKPADQMFYPGENALGEYWLNSIFKVNELFEIANSEEAEETYQFNFY